MISAFQDDRPIQTRIRVRIPKQYQKEPVISDLITRYGITVNITAALLSANAREDGWFDLELSGRASSVHTALDYLNDLNMEIWHDSNDPTEGW